MDQKDEFSKWMKSIEEALSGEAKVDEEILEQGSCGCGAWNCPKCFPDESNDLAGIEGQQIPAIIVIQPQDGGTEIDQSCSDEMTQQQMPGEQPQGIGMAGTHPVDGDTYDHDEEDEIDVTMMGDQEFAFGEEDSGLDLEQRDAPRSGRGVKLGSIVQKFVKTNSEGDESPMTYGDDLEEAEFDDEEVPYGDAAPVAQQNYSDEMSQIDPDEALEIIGKIKYMQDVGLSKSNRAYTEDELAQLPAVKLKQVQQQVMGGMQEAFGDEPPKPTKTRTKARHALDDLDGLTAQGPDQPLSNYAPDDGEYNDTMDRPGAAPTPSMPRASAADTRARTASMNPSELMRDMMSRISPDAGGDEGELPQEPQDQENAVVARTARDVPAAISSAMQATGTQVPEWHTVNNLPGYRQQNVRGMGRQIFGMFTRTPLEQIQTIANVDGQGPNTDAEMRAVASWLHQNADDLGEVELNHGRAIPGYRPDVKEYSLNGVRFHVVRDPMGQYIYAYPDSDATTNQDSARLGGAGDEQPPQGRLGGNMPRLREETMITKLTITEAIKFDDIIRQGLTQISESMIDESSLSKLIGKQAGGQKLVQWLHRKHKLGNMADLQPQPFNERMMWKEFKRNPDNFVIVSATNGVAGIKPHEQMIKDRMAAASAKGKPYDPGTDPNLQYQVIAFTDDGQQVDPALLQPARRPGEEREVDPTVMKARMGKISGKDMQNPDNVFNLLADQIGTLKTVYLAGNAVERDKMAGRAELKKPDAALSQDEAMNTVFKKIRPVLKTLASQALSTINNRAKRFIDGGNFEGAQKVAASGAKLRQFLATIDKSGDINTSDSFDLHRQITKAMADASGARPNTTQFREYLNAAAKGSAAALKPILDAMRDNLVELT